MTMHYVKLGDISVHFRDDGDPDGKPIVFANSLGTDLRLWDPILPLLPKGLRFIRYDMRGHGLTDCPPQPYSMGALIGDAERLMDHLGITGAVFVGLSVGGFVAQGLAVKRPDLMQALVLSNTAVKIGTTAMWDDRISGVNAGGITALKDSIIERWFSKSFRKSNQIGVWENMLVRQPDEGYAGVSAAISGTDFVTPTSGLTLPTLTIAGSEDGSTPPDLMREMTDLIPGARMHLVRGAGHLPCVEKPGEYAEVLTEFLHEVGYA
jgi:3-oxoadipate enol-lactonase